MSEYAISDEHWAVVEAAIRFMAEDKGLSLTPEVGVQLIKDYWHLYDDFSVLQEYVDQKNADLKAAHKAALEAQLAEIENE